jgi:hypothetical protein
MEKNLSSTRNTFAQHRTTIHTCVFQHDIVIFPLIPLFSKFLSLSKDIPVPL